MALVPKLRYASTLKDSISDVASSIIVNSRDLLEGKSLGGVATAPLATGDFIRLLKPDPTDPQTWMAEVMEIVTISTGVNGEAIIAVDRTPGAAPEATGSWTGNTFTADPGGNYSFTGGVTVENLHAKALLTESAYNAAGDYYLHYDAGSVAFLNTGVTVDGGTSKKVLSGMTVSAFFGYRTASLKQINFGLKLPDLEFTIDLQHQFPDNRFFKLHAHRCAITPENGELQFNPTDWIGSELMIDMLKSTNPAHAANPMFYATIDNDPVTLQPVADPTDEYSVGVYELFLTPTSTSKAQLRGLPTTRYSMGNVRVGGFSSPQTFLEHLVGVPQELDKKIRTRKQYKLTTTIENLRAENLALLFDGTVTATDLGAVPTNTLITVGAAPAAPYALKDVHHPLGFILVSPN